MKQRARAGTGRRILVAHPVPGLYGADRMMLAAMSVLAAGGDIVTIVVPETGPLLPLIERTGIATRMLKFPVLRKALLRPAALVLLVALTPRDVFRLWRVIRKEAPDLVYVNTVTLPHWLAAARLAGVPTLCHVREAEDAVHTVVARLLLAPVRLASVVIANSAATAGWLTLHQPAISDRARVLHNGFTFPVMTAPPAMAAAPARLVVVGRLSPRKGQHVALRAVASLVRAGRDIELHLVGDVFRGYEWYEQQLVADVEELGLTGRVFFDGFQPEPTASYLSAAIVLVPSAVEPFGNVAVEAMAIGRPVIASRVGGLPEIIDDEQTGLLVPPGDPAALAAAISRLLDDGALAQRLAAAGATTVRERFGTARFATELRQAVAAAIGGR